MVIFGPERMVLDLEMEILGRTIFGTITKNRIIMRIQKRMSPDNKKPLNGQMQNNVK